MPVEAEIPLPPCLAATPGIDAARRNSALRSLLARDPGAGEVVLVSVSAVCPGPPDVGGLRSKLTRLEGHELFRGEEPGDGIRLHAVDEPASGEGTGTGGKALQVASSVAGAEKGRLHVVVRSFGESSHQLALVARAIDLDNFSLCEIHRFLAGTGVCEEERVGFSAMCDLLDGFLSDDDFARERERAGALADAGGEGGASADLSSFAFGSPRSVATLLASTSAEPACPGGEAARCLAIYALVLRGFSSTISEIGLVLNGRENQTFPPGLGSFCRVAPLAVPPVRGDDTFDAYAQSVAARLEETCELQHFRNPGAGSREPVWWFEFHAPDVPLAEITPGIRLRPGEHLLQVVRHSQELRVTLFSGDADGDSIDAGQFAGVFADLLAIAGDARTTVDQIGERALSASRQSYERLNATNRDFPRDLCLHDWFAENARRFSERVAVVRGNEYVTYSCLDERSNGCARALIREGVGPEDVVAVRLSPSVSFVVVALGILKAGAAYLPVCETWPASRAAQILASARPKRVVKPAGTSVSGEMKGGSIDVEALLSAGGGDARPLPARCGPRNLAYVIFTSGSTGEPKGTMMEHRAVGNTLDWMRRECRLSERDRAALLSSTSFDLSVFDIFGMLACGGSVCVLDRTVIRDPDQLIPALSRAAVTVWNSVPALLQQVLTHGRAEEAFARLRLYLISGDKIPPSLPAALTASNPDAVIFALGGATECAIWSNFHELKSASDYAREVPYGRPMQNCRYEVVDAGAKLLPVECAGELLISGACLARGYLGAARLTAQAFPRIASPGEEKSRRFATGDLAKLVSAGHLLFRGRKGADWKVRGYRVDLGEIESVILRYPGITATVVTVIETQDVSWIGALFVASDEPDNAPLRAFLERQLPEYAVPAILLAVDSLPLTENQKVDRSAARRWIRERLSTRSIDPPQTATEHLLAEIWSHQLGMAAIGRADNFFQLGGHSIAAARVAAAVEARFAAGISLETFLMEPVLRDLAAKIDRQIAAAPTAGDAREPVWVEEEL